MERNDWIYIDDVKEIPSDVMSIHCDTRDFHVVLSSDKVTKENEFSYKLINQKSWKVCSVSEQNEIIPWLKSLEKMSGGKAEWRCLNFSSVQTRTGWLKYIRCYRIDYNMFVVCDNESRPIDTTVCTEEHLEKEYLNTH